MMDKQNQFEAQHHATQPASSQPVTPSEDQEQLPALPQGWRYTSQGKNPLEGAFYLSKLVERRSRFLVSLLGYGLLVFTLVDFSFIIIPPHLTDPVWEFQTIGELVEHVAALLLGLLFIFYRHEGYVGKRERYLLVALSWGSLLIGLLYLLLIPLGITDTWRIYQRNNTQVTAQLTQQTQQFQQIKGQLSQASDQQLQRLVASFAPQGRSPEIKDPSAFKDQFLDRVAQAERETQAQAKRVRTGQNQTLIKNSVKWNLGALIAGTLLIWIWHLTGWVRVNKQNSVK